METEFEFDYLLSKPEIKTKCHVSPTDSTVIYKFTTESEAKNYETIQEHNKDWESSHDPVFIKYYGGVQVQPDQNFNFVGLSKHKVTHLIKFENLFNFSHKVSHIGFKLGRWTFDKDTNQKKIEKKELIDNNTTSKEYSFRRSNHELANEQTDELIEVDTKPHYNE